MNFQAIFQPGDLENEVYLSPKERRADGESLPHSCIHSFIRQLPKKYETQESDSNDGSDLGTFWALAFPAAK